MWLAQVSKSEQALWGGTITISPPCWKNKWETLSTFRKIEFEFKINLEEINYFKPVPPPKKNNRKLVQCWPNHPWKKFFIFSSLNLSLREITTNMFITTSILVDRLMPWSLHFKSSIQYNILFKQALLLPRYCNIFLKFPWNSLVHPWNTLETPKKVEKFFLKPLSKQSWNTREISMNHPLDTLEISLNFLWNTSLIAALIQYLIQGKLALEKM